MSSLVFLQFPFLLGLLAVALPPIIHLIHRQRRRRVPFSTLRFLLQTDRRSARKHRLVDFLVLALRMLLLLFLVLALAQPVLRPAGSGNVEFGRLRLAVVIDDSMSMQRSTGGARLFDKALEAARTILRGVPQDGEAFVLLSSGRTPDAVKVPASPPGSLADLVGELRPSYGGRPLQAAINDAVAGLKSEEHRHRALVVIGDFQKRSLDLAESLNRELLKKEVHSVHAVAVSGEQTNVGIQEATAWPASAFPGTPVRFKARVFNSAPARTEASVSLWVEDRKVQGERVVLEADSSGEVVFDQVMNDPGTHRVSVRLEPDGLAGDNAWYLAVRILPQARVLVVSPIPKTPGGASESFYLETALNPLSSPNYSGASPVRMETESYLTAGRRGFSDYDFVFLIAADEMSERLRKALADYVTEGGHAAVFPGLGMGEGAAKSGSFENRSLAGLEVGGAWFRGADEAALGFGDYDQTHPVFSLLARSAPQLFSAVAFNGYLAVGEKSLTPYDRVLARFSDGAPALIESPRGKGFSLVWTTGCHTWWNDLPLRPLFLPLLFESLKYAKDAAKAAVRGGNVDEGFALEVAAADFSRQARVKRPSGEIQRLTLAKSRTELDFYDANEPGFYTVELEGENEEPVTVAVNVDSKESDLRAAERADVERYFPALTGIEEDALKVARHLAHSTQGFPLGGWLLALALLALLGEIYVANALLRAEEARPGWLSRLRDKMEGEKKTERIGTGNGELGAGG